MSASRSARQLLVGLGAGALLAAALPITGRPRGLAVLDASVVAHVSGVLAGYLAAVLVLLMSRTPWLERRVGPAVLTRWHRQAARPFLALIALHATAAVGAWADARHDDALHALREVLGLPGLVEATLGTLTFLAVAAMSVLKARRHVSHDTWHTLHLLTYTAVVLAFVHELAGPDLAGRPVLQVLWTLLHGYVLALVLRHRVLAPLEGLWRHRLRVAAVVPEAPDVVSIVMRGRHLDELGAQPGQFFRWRFVTAGTWRTTHPFSLSAVPRDDQLRITIKAVGDGTRLLHTIRPGTLVLPEGPSGALTPQQRRCPSVLLIAGGLGITPIRALLESFDLGAGRVTLLYRASSPTDIVFRHELEHLARERGIEILWLVGSSHDPALALTADNLRRLVPDVAERDVYLCASPRLAAAVRGGLRGAGLPRRQLHDEAFAF